MKDADTKVVYCGIDVSKTSFDGYCQGRSFKFKNEYQGYRKFVDTIKDRAVHCVMEATGPYYLGLAVYLYQQGSEVSVINPLVIKRFSQMRMIRAKTDKADAKLIAMYAEKEEPKLWSPLNPVLHEIAQLQATMNLLEKQDRMLKESTRIGPCSTLSK
ncbi:MAG: transposase [Verrucomicrobiota bacterium]